ncbi:hypothetical protein [Lactobacillus sp. CBA3606]|uniref:hypothetical protein n=1 Tax=Lactobacillus sp. CBA3606 TaxID=2099789 RepID=UPI001F3209BE|nr:hypothetical protein [Lactobacillus sp. CBA3606]
MAQLGQQFQHDDYHEIKAYFAAKNTGLIIPITAFTQIPKISLAMLRHRFENFVAPRQYLFLDQPTRQAQLAFLLQQPGFNQTNIDWQSKYEHLV